MNPTECLLLMHRECQPPCREGVGVSLLFLLTSFGMHLGFHCHYQTCFIFLMAYYPMLLTSCAHCCDVKREHEDLVMIRCLSHSVVCLLHRMPSVMPTATTSATQVSCAVKRLHVVHVVMCKMCWQIKVILPLLYYERGFGSDDSSAVQCNRMMYGVCFWLDEWFDSSLSGRYLASDQICLILTHKSILGEVEF